MPMNCATWDFTYKKLSTDWPDWIISFFLWPLVTVLWLPVSSSRLWLLACCIDQIVNISALIPSYICYQWTEMAYASVYCTTFHSSNCAELRMIFLNCIRRYSTDYSISCESLTYDMWLYHNCKISVLCMRQMHKNSLSEFCCFDPLMLPWTWQLYSVYRCMWR